MKLQKELPRSIKLSRGRGLTRIRFFTYGEDECVSESTYDIHLSYRPVRRVDVEYYRQKTTGRWLYPNPRSIFFRNPSINPRARSIFNLRYPPIS